MAEETKKVRALTGFPVPYEQNPRGAVVAGEVYDAPKSAVDSLVEDRLVEDISEEDQYNQEDTAPLVGRHVDYFKEQNPEAYEGVAIVYSEGNTGVDSVIKTKKSVAQAQAELNTQNEADVGFEGDTQQAQAEQAPKRSASSSASKGK